MKTLSRAAQWFYWLVLLPLVCGAAGWQGWQWWHWASAPAVTAVEAGDRDLQVLVEIPDGTTTWEIGSTLAAAGTIRSPLAWQIWALWLNPHQESTGSFKAGTYTLSPQASLPEIAEQIRQGATTQQSFAIPEGASIEAQAFIAASQEIPRDRYPWLPADLSKLEACSTPTPTKGPKA